jgi:cell division transport system permease protein
MNAWLQQHRYACAITVRRMLAQPFSAFTNLLVMALALAVPILGAAILISVQPVARQLSILPELTIFMKVHAPTTAAPTVAARIEGEFREQIHRVRVVSRDAALTALQRHPIWAEAVAMLPDNPLPDTVIVTLRQDKNGIHHAKRLAQTWKTWNDVDRIQLDNDWVARLEALLRFSRISLSLLASGIAMVVLATIFNTVRMQALTQREEIAVVRLVGATESFVRRPFLYLGMLSGTLSALLGIFLARLALFPLNNALFNLAHSYGTTFVLRLPDFSWLLATVAVTAILATLSAQWSVTRHSKL